MESKIFFFRIIVIAVTLIIFFLLDLACWHGLKILFAKKSTTFIQRAKRINFWSSFILVILFSVFFALPKLDFIQLPRIVFIVLFFSVLASKIIFSLWVLIENTGYYLRKKTSKNVEIESIDEKRREIIYTAGIIGATLPFYILTRGATKGAYNYKVHYEKIVSPNIPKAFDGKRIVQLSDIHSGSFFNKDAVYKGIVKVLEHKPDLFFFTGDLVNNRAEEMESYMDIFSPIKAEMGMYSTLGNHDYGDYWKWDNEAEKSQNLIDLKKHHKDLKWRLLLNENETITYKNERLNIIGVENWGSSDRFQKFGDIDNARKNMQKANYNILLSHDPTHWDKKIAKFHPEINLTLSGHTHGMQFGIENKFIKWSPVKYLYPHWAGMYTEGNQKLYVNRGFGFLGFPGRVGILPEITVFELKHG